MNELNVTTIFQAYLVLLGFIIAILSLSVAATNLYYGKDDELPASVRLNIRRGVLWVGMIIGYGFMLGTLALVEVMGL